MGFLLSCDFSLLTLRWFFKIIFEAEHMRYILFDINFYIRPIFSPAFPVPAPLCLLLLVISFQRDNNPVKNVFDIFFEGRNYHSGITYQNILQIWTLPRGIVRLRQNPNNYDVILRSEEEVIEPQKRPCIHTQWMNARLAHFCGYSFCSGAF